MCNEILSENANLILDEVERALCLPVLLGILYFTIILAIPLGMQIYKTVEGHIKSNSKKPSCRSESFVSRIKGMIGLALFPNSESASDSSSPYRNPRSFDEYDCDEYDVDD
ncbi:uncharacterized protein LOC105692276 [Athalia rosae]|uniref:uncharacterized protein LOC105692276 n=1 Tax=Athalia rosae TaxID=37344 RepID=UPI0020337FE1|nr:uncharacterized protein LOC105692276 [Athalia rosae]